MPTPRTLSESDQSPAIEAGFPARSLLYGVAAPVIVVVGIGLALVQFCAGRDLWMDEAMLAINILRRSCAQLFQPLDFVQSAPVGFLLCERLLVGAVPNPDYALRLFPLGCFVAALLSFERICRRHIFRDGAALAALSLFAFSRGLVYYASEIKQYGCDVLFATLLAEQALSPESPGRRRTLRMAVLGAVAVFFSNAACLVLPGVWLCWMLGKTGDVKSRLRDGVAAGLCWTVSFGAYFALFYHDANREQMTAYWTNFISAFPFRGGIGFAASLRLIADKAGRLFLLAFGFLPIAVLVPVAAAAGLARLLRRRAWSLLALLAMPLILHILMASLGQYPLSPRLMLYQIPLFLLAMAAPGPASSALETPRPWRAAAALVVPMFALLATAVTLPLRRSEIRPCIQYLAKNIQRGDSVRGEPFAFYPFAYYTDTGRLPQAIPQRAEKGATGAFFLYAPFCPFDSTWCPQTDALMKGRTWIVMAEGGADAFVPDVWVNRPVFRYFRNSDFSHISSYQEHLAERHGGTLLDEFQSTGTKVALYTFPENPAFPHPTE